MFEIEVDVFDSSVIGGSTTFVVNDVQLEAKQAQGTSWMNASKPQVERYLKSIGVSEGVSYRLLTCFPQDE